MDLGTRTERWILGRSDHEGWRSCWASWYWHVQRTWIPQGRPQAGLAAGGRGGRSIGASAYWTCGSTAHFSANCLRNMQTRGGGRGLRDSGFRGGRSSGSGRSGVLFVGLSTVWGGSGLTFYVTDEGQLLSDITEYQQDKKTV